MINTYEYYYYKHIKLYKPVLNDIINYKFNIYMKQYIQYSDLYNNYTILSKYPFNYYNINNNYNIYKEYKKSYLNNNQILY
jgi:hypothetical protein